MISALGGLPCKGLWAVGAMLDIANLLDSKATATIQDIVKSDRCRLCKSLGPFQHVSGFAVLFLFLFVALMAPLFLFDQSSLSFIILHLVWPCALISNYRSRDPGASD